MKSKKRKEGEEKVIKKADAQEEDPGSKQNAEERRKIRSEYRKLMRVAVERKDEILRPDTAALEEILQQVDQLHERVRKPREQAVDSELLCQLADFGLEMAKRFSATASGMTPKEYIVHLRNNFVLGIEKQKLGEADPAAFEWRRMGQQVSKYFESAPSYSWMQGLLDVRPRERKLSQRRAREQLGELVRPEEVTDMTEEQVTAEQTKHMEEMYRVLKKAGQVSIGQLVNNPRSFAQTVENIFTLSFLVRDGRAKISKLDGWYSVEACKAPASGDWSSGAAISAQFIMSFSLRDWNEMQQQIKGEPMIRHRNPFTEKIKRPASSHNPEGKENQYLNGKRARVNR